MDFKEGDWVFFKDRTSWATFNELAHSYKNLKDTILTRGPYQIEKIDGTSCVLKTVDFSGFSEDWFIHIGPGSEKTIKILFG